MPGLAKRSSALLTGKEDQGIATSHSHQYSPPTDPFSRKGHLRSRCDGDLGQSLGGLALPHFSPFQSQRDERLLSDREGGKRLVSPKSLAGKSKRRKGQY